MKIKPLHDFVLVRPIEHEKQTTKSGLVIPDSARVAKSLARGQVVAVGPGTSTVDTSKLAVGRNVLYNPHAPISVGGNTDGLQMMKYGDIFAVEEPEFFVTNVKMSEGEPMAELRS